MQFQVGQKRLRELAQKYGTPLFVYSHDMLQARAGELVGLVRDMRKHMS